VEHERIPIGMASLRKVGRNENNGETRRDNGFCDYVCYFYGFPFDRVFGQTADDELRFGFPLIHILRLLQLVHPRQ